MKRYLQIAGFLVIAGAFFGRATVTAGPGAVPSNVIASRNALPVVAEHKYRMLARVRPLLFWISKDNVGGARIDWRGADDGSFGIDILIGSDPDRAPRRINKWGFIAEQVRGSQAEVVGVMKEANEQSIEDVKKQLGKEGDQGSYTYSAIQGTATAQQAQAAVTTVRVERDLTFRDIDALLALVRTSDKHGGTRSVALPAGTRPGFLVALQELVKQTTDACQRSPAALKPPRSPLQYVYFGNLYDLTMSSADYLKSATIDGHGYSDVVRSNFEIKNHNSGERTGFQITYGTRGPLTGVPVAAAYQARWWLELQLFLDDHTRF
jgi:hypothetical protein